VPPGVGWTTANEDGWDNQWITGGINGIPLNFTRPERWRPRIDGVAGKLTNSK
jgi:hypothetical protein